MSLTARVLLGLVAALAAGIAISLWPSPPLLAVVSAIEPLGRLFVNAIRMTVIPLVVSSLIVGVTSAPDVRSIGRIGWRALVVFVLTLLASTTFAALVGQPLLARLTVDPAAAATLRASTADPGTAGAAPAAKVPTFAQWVVSLVPDNPIRAAADGALLPLIIFALALAIALLRMPPERRQGVVGFFSGLFDAMLVLVRWVLALAPIGVFALALPLAVRLGVSVAGAVAYYIALVAAVTVLFAILVLYPAATLIGGVGLRDFARASAPAQAVAFSARSSLAALPAMMQGATTTLALPREVSSFFLPLAASVFRAGGGVGLTIGVLFIARLYGVPLEPPQIATVILSIVLTSFSVPGIPNGSILVMVPVMVAAGVPAEGVGILLGIDTVPDMFRTATNVTGHMAAAAIVARGTARAPAAIPADTAA